MRTCRRLGIRTVAVYSDADARRCTSGRPTRPFGWPPPARDSYLRVDAHPRRGTATRRRGDPPGLRLSRRERRLRRGVHRRRPGLGRAAAGGDARARRQGRAKALAERHDVPVLPGYHGEDQTDDVLTAHAGADRLPAAGQGERRRRRPRMRVVRDPGELARSVEAARREAAAAFGDDRLLLERYVERPRHVEVQILGDAHGNVVHLGERECSIQRRHQKLIEESPSPAVTPALGAAMGDAALRLARAAGYASAGTVEFLLDEDGRVLLPGGQRAAAGRAPGDRGGDRPRPGGAAAARRGGRAAAASASRTCASTARDRGAGRRRGRERGLPALDRAVTASPSPTASAWTPGSSAGSVVSPFYDSLVAKVIAHGPDRAAAIATLANAIDELRLDGVETNVDLLAAVVAEPAFRAGDLHTGFLDEHRIVERLRDVPPRPSRRRRRGGRSAGGRRAGRRRRGATRGRRAPGRHGRGRGAVVGLAAGERVEAAVDVDAAAPAAASPRSTPVHGRARHRRPRRGRTRVRGRRRRRPARGRPTGRRHRDRRGTGAPGPPLPPPSRDHGPRLRRHGGAIAAPMPGRIVRIHVAAGRRCRGDPAPDLLEAMKMEHVIAAAVRGPRRAAARRRRRPGRAGRGARGACRRWTGTDPTPERGA